MLASDPGIEIRFGEQYRSLLEVVSTQRACRRFSDEDVSDAEIEAILHAATFAPSSQNHQPWVFVVVRDEAARREAGQLIRDIWNRFGREFTRRRSSASLFADVDQGLGEGGVAGAPALIVVGGDTSQTDVSVLKESVLPAVQNLLLAAGALGLGTCLTTIASLDATRCRALVGFPERIEPLALIPLGHPARPLGPPRREPFALKSHRERYGRGWDRAVADLDGTT